MVGIVLAAGGGTRFSAGGCCKPLLPVNGKPLIDYSLENLISLGVREILIVVGKYAEEIRSAVGNCRQGVPVRYVEQTCPRGIMNALYLAAENVGGETVVLQLSDEIFIEVHSGEIRRMEDADFLCGYTVPENKQIIRENYALSCVGERIEYTVEKPEEIINDKKGTGFCVFSPACMALLRKHYSEESSAGNLCDFINLLIADGKKGIAVHIAEEEININDPGMYLYAAQRTERAGHNE